MAAPSARFEHFPHDADVGVRGFGASVEEAFAQAGLALTAVVTDPAQVLLQQPVALQCRGRELALLLYDFLNAVVYEMATRKLVFGRFEVQLDGDRLAARAWGEPLDLTRHEPVVEIKGATMTELDVHRRPDGVWVAQCVVDV